MKTLRICVFAIAIIWCFKLDIHAQSFTGSIVGTVKNTEGAVVPGAEVTIIHEQTNRTVTATANGEGYYVLRPCPSAPIASKRKWPGSAGRFAPA